MVAGAWRLRAPGRERPSAALRSALQGVREARREVDRHDYTDRNNACLDRDLGRRTAQLESSCARWKNVRCDGADAGGFFNPSSRRKLCGAAFAAARCE
jgi:hypothetical protein